MNHQTRRFFWWMLLQAQARYELADNIAATSVLGCAVTRTAAEQTARTAWLFHELATTVAETSTVHEPPTDLALREWVTDAINTIIQSKDQPPAINVQYR